MTQPTEFEKSGVLQHPLARDDYAPDQPSLQPKCSAPGKGVMFQAAVTDAAGHIVKQTSEPPPKYLVKLLFSFRGITEVEVPAERIHADK